MNLTRFDTAESNLVRSVGKEEPQQSSQNKRQHKGRGGGERF